ncbi:MAG: hypothetical protein M3Y67_10035, partial [Pseudomonadota bacterium]|nr:hypothetical protein [Pseudomonadota bacterium]
PSHVPSQTSSQLPSHAPSRRPEPNLSGQVEPTFSVASAATPGAASLGAEPALHATGVLVGSAETARNPSG